MNTAPVNQSLGPAFVFWAFRTICIARSPPTRLNPPSRTLYLVGPALSAITRLSLHLGVVVLLAVVLLFGGGIYAATQVQQDLLPDISIPAVIVITPDP